MAGTRAGLDLAALEPRRVVLIKPSALGDVANATPVLAALRGRWPSSRFAWVINAGLAGLVEGLPGLDEVIRFDRARLRPTPRGAWAFGRFLAGLRGHRFDLAIDLQGLLRSGLMTRATGAPVRVGLSDAREGATLAYTHRVAMPSGPSHAVDRLMRVARAFGVEPGPPRFLAAMSEADRRWARDVLADVPRPRLILNVGARWETKRWPPDHFAEVARRAVARFGAGLVAVGAPEDRPLVEALRASLTPIPILNLCAGTTLPRLAALASASDLVLSNDTGPLHLAVAAGARTVGVYTCTDPRQNGPYGPRASAVSTHVACAASYLQCCGRLTCMAELTPDRVWPAVALQLTDALAADSAA